LAAPVAAWRFGVPVVDHDGWFGGEGFVILIDRKNIIESA